MTVQCCKCKKVRDNGQWTDRPLTIQESKVVSHAYCDRCFVECYIEIFASEASLADCSGAGAVQEALKSSIS